MNRILLHLLIAITATTATLAEDTLVFQNGDVLTGKVLKQDAERVSFKPSAFSKVTLKSADLAEIHRDMPERGERARPLRLKPAAQKSAWSGQAGMAIALRESNSLRRQGENFVERDQEFESYRVYGNVKWQGGQNDLKWNWTYRYSRTDVRKNDDYLNLTQNYKHAFSDRIFTRAKLMYQQDFRRGIENEYLQTAEIGVNWLDSKRLKFNTSAGGGYHRHDRIQEKYSDAQVKFILEESLRCKIIDSLTLFQQYTHLGNLEKYHFIFNSGLENKLIHDVFLRVEYRLDRDSDVDYNDKSYYDKALLTSLLYKF